MKRVSSARRVHIFAFTMLGIVLLAAAVVGYMKLVQHVVYEECSGHLEEIYSQVNASFKDLVSKNWNLLDGWGYHIDRTVSSEDDLVAFLQEEQGKWGFTDFYFLDKDGNYLTFMGEKGFLNLDAQIDRIMIDGNNAVVDALLPDGSSLVVFAVPACGGSYREFPYDAVAVSYNTADMARAIDVNAFDGQSDCYVVYPDGRILLSVKEEGPSYNFVDMLAERSSLAGADLERLRKDLAAGSGGVVGYQLDGTEHYLVYRPVGFQDWMMLGNVPVSVVNASMNQIQWATIAVLVVVFAPIVLIAVLFLLHRNRRKLDAKELAIECREQLFSMLVRNADDIYVMFSPEGFAVEYVSPNVEKLLGVSSDAVKRDIRVLSESAVDPSGDPGIEAIASLEEGGCLQMHRERIRPTTGEVRWYQETLYRESIKGVDKYVLVLSDRTEERKSSLLLEQALDIARSSNEAKSQFLANMSHDIRTPINAIVGMTKIARESGEASEKITSCLDAITVSSRHLLELINDVLDMSRIESGQLELQERRFDLDDVVAEVEAIIRPQAQAKCQDLHVDCSGVEHKVFAGDELRISQILLNLASNAVKYTQEGGSISFVVSELEKTRSSYARLVFAILDNGMGMSPEFVERIFDPFERSEEAFISRIQGTGLGMSITKALIDAMGGVVEVDSEVGSGSAFRVTLELRLASPKETRPPLDDAPTVAPYDFEGKRFLLAEDNELNAEIMIELLGHRGAEVEWAENGEAACDAFARRPVGYYDAVLMDVMMPIMNGYEAARAIRACAGTCAADVKIIALTANAFAEDVKTALDAGMDAHVAKPVDIDGLAGVLGRICG